MANREMDPSVCRLLGLDRDWRLLDAEEAKHYLPSKERQLAFDQLDTNTMPRKPNVEKKKGIVSELLRNRFLSEELLRGNPTVYLGSATDVEYPLAIGARNIVLVDPVFSDAQYRESVRDKIRVLTGTDPVVDERGLSFRFDFGNGGEKIRIDLAFEMYTSSTQVASKTTSYQIPDQTGTILLFASQGPTGRVEVNEEMQSCIAPGGSIIDGPTLYQRKRDSDTWEKKELGKL